MRAHVRWRRLRHYDDPVGWIRRVALNLVRDDHRRSVRKRRAVARLAAEPAAVGAEPEPDGLTAMLAALPQQQRTAVALFYVEGLTVAEVAETMGARRGIGEVPPVRRPPAPARAHRPGGTVVMDDEDLQLATLLRAHAERMTDGLTDASVAYEGVARRGRVRRGRRNAVVGGLAAAAAVAGVLVLASATGEQATVRTPATSPTVLVTTVPPTAATTTLPGTTVARHDASRHDGAGDGAGSAADVHGHHGPRPCPHRRQRRHPRPHRLRRPMTYDGIGGSITVRLSGGTRDPGRRPVADARLHDPRRRQRSRSRPSPIRARRRADGDPCRCRGRGARPGDHRGLTQPRPGAASCRLHACHQSLHPRRRDDRLRGDRRRRRHRARRRRRPT